jgi:hypothetical protein
MNLSVVWVMVSMVHIGFAYGPEFRNEEHCKAAAKQIQETMAKVKEGWTREVPTCIRIEK